MGASVSSPDRKIVLLGKTGGGKSSTGNTILRKRIFTTDASPNSITDISERGERKIFGQKITVIDTPGVFDTSVNNETIRSEIIRSIISCSSGVDAFVIVLKVERYTTQEREIVDLIGQNYGEEIFGRAVVLFTHGEQLNGRTIEEFVQESATLQALVTRCGGRCHVIDNKYWNKCLYCLCSCGYKSNRAQVNNLLDTINNMVRENGRYTNEMLEMVKRMIQEEMTNTSEDDVSPNQQSERAERIVHDSLLIKFAGATTGALTGALMGIGFCVATCISVPPLVCAAVLKVAGRTAAGVGSAYAAGGAGAGGGAYAAGGAGGAYAAGGAGAYAAGGGAYAAGGAGAYAAGGSTYAAGGGAYAAGGAAGGAYAAGGVILSGAALAGAAAGAVTGWDAAAEADSVSDAMWMGAATTYENGRVLIESAQACIYTIFNPRSC